MTVHGLTAHGVTAHAAAAPFLLGIGVAFGGALLLAGGSELQSRAVHLADGRWRVFLRSPRWLAGLLLLGVAVSTNFIALALAPVSAVQSVSIAALAASTLFGALTGGVVLTRVGTISVAACVIGILGFVGVIAQHRATGQGAIAERLPEVTTILVVLTVLGIAAVLMGRERRDRRDRRDRDRDRWTRFAGLAVAAMVFGSITTVFKTLVALVLDRGPAALAAPGPLAALSAVLLGGAVANVLLQRSHRFFPAPAVVAAITIVDPLTAAVIGIAVLGEVSLTASAVAGLVGFGAVACLGVLGVSGLRRHAGSGQTDPERTVPGQRASGEERSIRSDP